MQMRPMISMRIILIDPVANQRLVATLDFLHIPYVAREASIRFPKPFVLQIYNDAACIFANGTCFRSRMKQSTFIGVRNGFTFSATKLYASPLGSALMTILQSFSPKYSPLRSFALCKAALWCNVPTKPPIILIEIKTGDGEYLVWRSVPGPPAS